MATSTMQMQEYDGGKPMTLLEHLQELRGRLIWCAIGLVIAVIISSIFTNQVMLFLLKPAQEQSPQLKLIFTAPMENVATYFKVALLGGLILAMPVLVYQALMFVLPALTPQEKR
jgi:sec-independent protein translocase protein TatC